MSYFPEELSDRLVAIYKTVNFIEEHALKEGNIPLTVSEMHLINYVGKQKVEITLSSIAQGLSVTRPSATIAVNKLQKKGYLDKISSEEDGRVTYVVLTKQGLRVYRLHKLCQKNAITKMGQTLSDEQREVLLQGIDVFTNYFEQLEENK